MNAKSKRINYLERYYEKNRESIRKKQREYLLKLRQESRMKIFELLGGALCVCCGEAEKTFLTMDHKNGGGTAHRKLIGNNDRRLYKDILSDPLAKEKYRILCWNCNSATRWGRICPHMKGEA